MSTVEWEYHPPLRPREPPELHAMTDGDGVELTLFEADGDQDNTTAWITASVASLVDQEEWR